MLAKKVYKENYSYEVPKIVKKVNPLKKKQAEFPFMLIGVMGVIQIILIILVIHQSTQLISKQYNLCELTETKKVLEQQNLKLVNDVNSLESLERIEYIAQVELKMSRPDLDGNVLLIDENKDTIESNHNIKEAIVAND